MKRKLLLAFANWLERSRTPFDMTDSRRCVSVHALRFAEKAKPYDGSTSSDLKRIFDIPPRQAAALYGGFDWMQASKLTRKVVASIVRNLARTGTVHWGKYADPQHWAN